MKLNYPLHIKFQLIRLQKIKTKGAFISIGYTINIFLAYLHMVWLPFGLLLLNHHIINVAKKLLIITSSNILRNLNGVMTFKMLHIPLKKLNGDKECFWLCRRQQMLHKGTSQGDYDINFTDKTILLNSLLLRWRVHLHKYVMKFK